MDFRPVRGLVRGVRGSAAFCKVWDWGGLNRSGRGTGWRRLGGEFCGVWNQAGESGTRLAGSGGVWERESGRSGRGAWVLREDVLHSARAPSGRGRRIIVLVMLAVTSVNACSYV